MTPEEHALLIAIGRMQIGIANGLGNVRSNLFDELQGAIKNVLEIDLAKAQAEAAKWSGD